MKKQLELLDKRQQDSNARSVEVTKSLLNQNYSCGEGRVDNPKKSVVNLLILQRVTKFTFLLLCVPVWYG